jgi:activator of HSP90 ATPase
MSTLTVKVDSQGSTINPSNTTLTTSTTTAGAGSSSTITTVGIQGTSGASVPISENIQVDIVAEGLNNGSVLVYKTNTSKWTSTKTLDLQIVDSGEF